MADVKADLRGWGQLFSRSVRKRTMVGVGVTTMQQMSGINAVRLSHLSLSINVPSVTLPLLMFTATILRSRVAGASRTDR